MTTIARKFEIDPEFRALIPPLTDQERAQLEANLLAAKHCHDSLKVWQPPEGKRAVASARRPQPP
jgi:hypothetical protein